MLGAALFVVGTAAPAHADPVEWLPLRASANVGCVQSNCSGPYHGYAAIDFLTGAGNPIYAAGPGTVIATGSFNTCLGDSTSAINSPNARGNFVQVDHGGGITTRYLHMSSRAVNNGQRVDQNTQLGTVGNTGASTCSAPHLHFDKRLNGGAVDPGTLKACHGSGVVNYPGATGYGSWNAIPFNEPLGAERRDRLRFPAQRRRARSATRRSHLPHRRRCTTAHLALRLLERLRRRGRSAESRRLRERAARRCARGERRRWRYLPVRRRRTALDLQL